MSNQRQRDEDIVTATDEIRKQFQPGGKLAPIDDLAEYERQMNALPLPERELTQEVTICANICQFLSEKNWSVPSQISAAIFEVQNLDVPARIARMREINQNLMELIHSVSADTELRM